MDFVRELRTQSLSIHDLTRRSTFEAEVTEIRITLSIHDLTRRSTKRVKRLTQNLNLSIHDLTRRSTALRSSLGVLRESFNSRPHKEVDSIRLKPCNPRKPFNSRPHKEVDNFLCSKIVIDMVFQFTTSQGGRPIQCALDQIDSPFNSRPHKEVDPMTDLPPLQCRQLSIHDLTRRSTRHVRVDS